MINNRKLLNNTSKNMSTFKNRSILKSYMTL